MNNLARLLCLALLPIVLAQNYCSVCSDHTMCKFKGKGPACGGNSNSGVSPAEAMQIVNLHNAYRARIANGEENRGKSGPQPPAANMQSLVWDDKLAEVAQRWADQCTFQHDKCRNDPRFKVGQNIYWSSGFSTVNWTRAIGAWYDEVKDFDGNSVNDFRLNHYTGHYTQLAWATTTLIGCARTTYGGAYRVQGYRPREFVLSASQSEAETTNKENHYRRVKKQSNLGFFGGATFDPSGAQGAITDSAGGSATPSRPNQPARPSTGNFPSNGNGGIDSGNGGNNPNFPIVGNRPGGFPGIDAGSEGNSPDFPIIGNWPNYPGNNQGYPNFPEYFGSASTGAYYYPGSGGYYSGGYYQSHPAYQQSGGQYPTYVPAGFAPYYTGYSQTNEFANTPQGLGFFDGEADENSPMRPIETNPVQLQLPTYVAWREEQISGKPSINTNTEHISSHEWQGNEWVPTNYDFVGRDQILICNYGPSGNYLGRPIYIEGKACASCPSGTTCRNGLCAAP